MFFKTKDLGPLEKCINCEKEVSLHSFRQHMVSCPGGSSRSYQIDVVTGEVSGGKCRLPSSESSIRLKISTSSTLSANCNQSDESSNEHSDELGTGTIEGSSKLIFVFILTLP